MSVLPFVHICMIMSLFVLHRFVGLFMTFIKYEMRQNLLNSKFGSVSRAFIWINDRILIWHIFMYMYIGGVYCERRRDLCKLSY